MEPLYMNRPVTGRARLRTVATLALLAMPAAGAAAQLAMPTTSDPRVGLSAGLTNAGMVEKNLKLVSNRPKPDNMMGRTAAGEPDLGGLTYANSDLAFRGNYVFQGNFNGFQIWDVSDPKNPRLRTSHACTTGQGDPSIFGNLLFISAEGAGNRVDCTDQRITEQVSKDRFRGVRIFDVSDLDNPKPVGWAQNCRGSHTNTLVPDPRDKNIVYIYISGSAGVRDPGELEGCSSAPPDSAGSSRGRIDIVRVPLDNPAEARVVAGARIFTELTAPQGRGGGAGGAAAAGAGRAGGAPPGGAGATPAPAAPRRGGPDQCHDITVYPEAGLAGGACGGYGILLDIRDPLNPRRLDAAQDTNFVFWHSATFSNDGRKVVFTDEWGGGTAPRCRAVEPIAWGSNAIFTIDGPQLKQHAYFKMPAVQSDQENCVAHNGSLVPIPGRDVMVQGWYQGGVSVFEFTDVTKPVELAYFDRGPLDGGRLYTGGSWGAYWYNGYIYSSEIARGLDIIELVPSDMLSKNEIDAARTVIWPEFNPQTQLRIVWPPSFALPRAYLDQLERNSGLAAERIAQVRRDLDAAERLSGTARSQALTRLATGLAPQAASARDSAKANMVVQAIRELATAR
jgi:hypothetical protein